MIDLQNANRSLAQAHKNKFLECFKEIQTHGKDEKARCYASMEYFYEIGENDKVIDYGLKYQTNDFNIMLCATCRYVLNTVSQANRSENLFDTFLSYIFGKQRSKSKTLIQARIDDILQKNAQLQSRLYENLKEQMQNKNSSISDDELKALAINTFENMVLRQICKPFGDSKKLTISDDELKALTGSRNDRRMKYFELMLNKAFDLI